MALQRTTKAFRDPGLILPGNNLQDFTSSGGGFSSAWTPGGTIIDPVSLMGAATAQKSFISASIRGSLILAQSPPGFGKFGRVIGGVLTGSGDPSLGGSGGVAGAPWVNPILPLPGDASLVADLWNPANDPLPPVANGSFVGPLPASQTVLPINCVINPPVPVQLDEASMAIGMWATPSLIGNNTAGTFNWHLYIFNAIWTVVYNDGS